MSNVVTPSDDTSQEYQNDSVERLSTTLMPDTPVKPKKPITLDDLLDRVSIGKYQYWVYGALTIGYFCEGAELIAISFLNVVLIDIWGISETEVGFIAVAIFGGLLIGSFFSGPISDRFGRRRMFMGSLGVVLFLCILSAFSPDFIFMLVSRGLFGVFAGVLLPISSGYLIEITPPAQRGRVMILAQSFFTLGEMFACGIVALTLSNIETGQWRLMLVLVTIPGILAFIVLLVFSLETPRFAFLTDTDYGFSILDKMYQLNTGTKNPLPITAEEKEQIRKWVEDQKILYKGKSTSYTPLFQGKNFRLTANLVPMWFLLTFIYYGVIYVYPLALVELDPDSGINDQSIASVFISVLGEIPSYLFCYLLVDHQRFGRKNSLVICFVGGTICLILSFFFLGWGFAFLIFGAKFFANSTFAFLYLYTSEAYHTSIRVSGVGMCVGTSRFSGVLMPWIVLPSLNLGPKVPFLIFGIMSGIAAFSGLLLPFDTLGRQLDQEEPEKVSEISMTELALN